MFSFTSPGMQIDNRVSRGRVPPTLRIQGQACHRIGTMLPEPGEPPKYAQLYIYDTENEIDNQIHPFRNNKDITKGIVTQLCKMLDQHNVHAKSFRMARDVLKNGQVQDFKLKLIAERKNDGRIYNQPTVSEVAALIVGDVDSAEKRDIILHKTGGRLKRIDEFHPAYLSYQYPLIFPYGEDGYRDGILLKYKDEVVVTKRNRLTIKNCRRYLDQLYFDGMAISNNIGFPDIFITFTCNPNWPEIQRELLKDNLKSQDRPDIITRIFKIKFEALMKDLTRKHILGKVLAYLYTIECQKRGLPHAHILIFLHPSSKYPNPEDINHIISAEIPNPHSQKELYNLVKKHMMHGPCGQSNESSPCMRNNRCSKFFPKKWKEETVVDQEGFPVYRRRRNGHTITKNKITLDNRHVVPYNPRLLLKYQAHINMEFCNQRTSIKYLFKYIHKGYDRISATVVGNNGVQQLDEIKQYLDCRYISPSEACWRIFGFSIHGRRPAVERMFYHLLGENSVYLTDNQDVEHVLEKPSVTESMFTSLFEANTKYSEA
ncbi:DNA helicase [Trifolium repens]|nr:DNA helicase [Trifolium repens]